jgi:pimeloyl-ACP methyl ester carboxylesterase
LRPASPLGSPIRISRRTAPPLIADEISFSDALAPTLYGLGHSLQEWAVAVLDHCEGEELIVVGSSVGGSCALEIARASPDQVRGIVLSVPRPASAAIP